MNEMARTAKPMARKQGLVIEELPDEVLVYDLDRDRAHCLNETAAFVWQRCDGRSSSEQIARTLGNHLNCEVDERVVWLALDQLRRSHLLEHSVGSPAMGGMNRRAMVRALGIATAVAIPLVTSILAPTVHASATCLPLHASCSSSGRCCSGFCDDHQCRNHSD